MFGQEIVEKKPEKQEPQTIAEAFPTETEFTLPDSDNDALQKMIDIYLKQVVTTGNIDFSTPEIRRAETTRFDLWYLLAHKHIPQILALDENKPASVQHINNILTSHGANLDDAALLLLQLHPKIDLVDLKGHGEITEELLAVSLFKGNYDDNVGRVLGQDLHGKKEQLKRRWEKYFHIPKEGYGRFVMILSLWNKWQWEQATTDSEEEKNLLHSEGDGYQFNENIDEEWKKQWTKTFGEIWPKSWVDEKSVENTLKEFFKKRIKLSDELIKSIILHPERRLSILLVKSYPLEAPQLIFLLKRLRIFYPTFAEKIVVSQHVFGLELEEILSSLERSKIEVDDDQGTHAGRNSARHSNTRARKAVFQHIRQVEKRSKDEPSWWNFLARFLLWRRNRQEFDGEFDMSRLQEMGGDSISLDDLLEEYEEMGDVE